MTRLVYASLSLAVAMMVAGCGPATVTTSGPVKDAPKIAPLNPAGAAEKLAVDADEHLQWAASVVQFDELSEQGDLTAKLFGTAGGDPAMNGLYTYVAFFVSPADGWRVFKIGDFLNYKVLLEKPGRVDLEVQESAMDEATGTIGARTRRMIVTWTPGAEDAPPAEVSVTPAE